VHRGDLDVITAHQIAKLLRKVLLDLPCKSSSQCPAAVWRGSIENVHPSEVIKGMRDGRYVLIERNIVEQIIHQLEARER
jgi:hypothetical protein